MIGLVEDKKQSDSTIHSKILGGGGGKVEEDAILRLVRMGYTEDEAVKLVKGL